MIIDSHCHLFVEDWINKRWWDGMARRAVLTAKKIGIEATPEDIRTTIIPEYWDPTAEKLIQEADEAGIDKTVMLVQDFGVGIGEAKVSIEEQNKSHADIAKAHPDKLIAFAGVDPRREGAVDLFEKCITEWGMKGLKLHSGAGFFLDDKVVYPLYEKALELNVPVVAHTGPILAPLRSKYCHPISLDNVLTDFPDLTVIAAHVSEGWWRDAIAIAASNPNMFVDISGWEEVVPFPEKYCISLREIIDEVGSDRVLFGTDGPSYRTPCPPIEYVKFVKGLPENAVGGVEFTAEEIEAILGGNAQRILKL